MLPQVLTTSSDGLIEYVPLTYNKLEEALDVIRKGFFVDETISVAVGLSKHPEAICELDDLVIEVAMDGISTIAVEKATGKVAGCLINKINVKENELNGFFEKFKCEHPTARAFLEANSELDKIINAFDFLQTDCYVESMFTGILPQFRRRGIASKLQAISLDIAQHLKNGNNVKISLNGNPLPPHSVPTATIGFPTSETMKNICKKLGYTIGTEIHFSKYKLQNSMLPVSVVSEIPPIMVVYKYL